MSARTHHDLKPYYRRTWSVRVTRSVRTDTGSRSEPDGELVGELEICIDFQALAARMAGAALRSKAHRSRTAGGAIVARAYNVQHERPAAAAPTPEPEPGAPDHA